MKLWTLLGGDSPRVFQRGLGSKLDLEECEACSSACVGGMALG